MLFLNPKDLTQDILGEQVAPDTQHTQNQKHPYLQSLELYPSRTDASWPN